MADNTQTVFRKKTLDRIASARVTKYEHYYVFVSGVLGLVVMKPDA